MTKWLFGMLGVCGLVFGELVFEPSFETEFQNAPDEVRVAEKSPNIMEHVDFDFGDAPLEIVEGFNGKAIYGVALDQLGPERTFLNLGGGYSGAESLIAKYDFLNENCASAEVGFTFEKIVSKHLVRSVRLGVSQPVYNMQESYRPTLSVNYGLTY